MSERLPSIGYLVFALTVSAAILYGQNAPTNSWMFRYVVEGDRNRLVSSSVCAIILFTSAMAAVLREQMRGVVVHPDGIEMRELLPLGWPRIKRFQWSQIDRLFVPPSIGRQDAPGTSPDTSDDPTGKSIRIDLWDGSSAWLPRVSNGVGLAVLLEKVALARAIPLEGGTGLLDDLGNPAGAEDEPAR